MTNPWQQVFEDYRNVIQNSYITERYGQHKSDESEETQALYDLRNKMKNMGKEAVVAYLKRSKMAPERKARLSQALGISISENNIAESRSGKVHVRVTKEDGSTFEKDIAPSQVAEYRKRYKTVVILGAEESSATGSSSVSNRGSDKLESIMHVDEDNIQEVAPPGAKAERMVKHIKKSYSKDGKLTDKEKSIAYATAWKSVEENKEGLKSKKTSKRWWDDDGDGVGYEPGEVSGKFKTKKHRKEQYSNWRDDFPEILETTKAQKSVEGKSHASYEDGDKKKIKKKFIEPECDCSHEVKESAINLANELGGEFVDIHEFKKELGKTVFNTVAPVLKKYAGNAIRAFTPKIQPIKISPIRNPLPYKDLPKVEPKIQPEIKPAPPGPLVPAKPGTKPVPAKPGTKPEPKTKVALALPKTTVDTILKIDKKTGTIVMPLPKSKSKRNPPIPPIPPVKFKEPPPQGPTGPTGSTKLDIPVIIPKVYLPDPVPKASQVRV